MDSDLNMNMLQFMVDFKSGCQIAFRKLFDATAHEVTRALALKCKWARRYELEDFVAIAYSKVYERRTVYNDYYHIKRSLVAIAHNEAVDYWEHLIRQKSWEHNWLYTNDTVCELFCDTVVDNYSPKVEQVLSVIPQLTPIQGKVFRLSFCELKDISEISDMLQIAMQTVRNHRASAIKMIQKILSINNVSPERGKYVVMRYGQDAKHRIYKRAVL
jgi:DNA-directed RNA polymerase specialized sigma24 family protein